jgi:hypothetical protein
LGRQRNHPDGSSMYLFVSYWQGTYALVQIVISDIVSLEEYVLSVFLLQDAETHLRQVVVNMRVSSVQPGG